MTTRGQMKNKNSSAWLVNSQTLDGAEVFRHLKRRESCRSYYHREKREGKLSWGLR